MKYNVKLTGTLRTTEEVYDAIRNVLFRQLSKDGALSAFPQQCLPTAHMKYNENMKGTLRATKDAEKKKDFFSAMSPARAHEIQCEADGDIAYYGGGT